MQYVYGPYVGVFIVYLFPYYEYLRIHLRYYSNCENALVSIKNDDSTMSNAYLPFSALHKAQHTHTAQINAGFT